MLDAQQKRDAEVLLLGLAGRDPETCAHSRRAAHYAHCIGQILELPEKQLAAVYYGTLLHDYGKIGAPDCAFAPRGLTAAEHAQLRQHPSHGAALLADPLLNFPPAVIDCVGEHHEWFDGRGYPVGRRGTDISLPARICAVADAFDALTADRPYRKGRSYLAAARELTQCAGTQFDPAVVAAFLRVPVAALVELAA